MRVFEGIEELLIRDDKLSLFIFPLSQVLSWWLWVKLTVSSVKVGIGVCLLFAT